MFFIICFLAAGAIARCVFEYLKEALEKDPRYTAFKYYNVPPRCEHCNAMHHKLALEPGRTSYHYEGPDGYDDPNRPVLLCEQCAQAHHEYWDEMWDSYNSGRL